MPLGVLSFSVNQKIKTGKMKEKTFYERSDTPMVIRRNFVALMLISICIYVSWTVFVNSIPKIWHTLNYKDVFIFIGVIGGVCLLMVIFSLSVISENWRAAYWIELDEEKIIGYSFNKKHLWEMRFDEINIMHPGNGYNPPFIFLAMVIYDFRGRMVFISIDVEKFGTLMEIIKSKAVNAKKINFKNWPTNRFMWNK